MPERLDFALKTGRQVATRGEPIDVSLDARFLYGAPAARPRRHRRDPARGGRRLRARRLSRLCRAGWLTTNSPPSSSSSPTRLQTDDKGHADLSDRRCPRATRAKPLEAKIIVDVAESGGRTVERVVTLPVRAKGAMIGVKKDFDESLGEGDTATFEAIAVAPDGARIARKGVTLVALSAHQRLPMVSTPTAVGATSRSSRRANRRRIGRHRRRRARQDRRAGRLGQASARPQIARRRDDELHLRRRLVGHGERRHARQRRRDARQGELRAGRGGQAAHRLALRRQGDGRAGRRQAREAHRRRSRRGRQRRAVRGRRAIGAPGAYAVAITQRPLDVKAKRMPGRALGLAWFAIDEAARKLDVAIDAPEKTRPRETADAADQDRRARAGRGGRGDGRRGRRRHPQSHAATRRPTRPTISSASASSRSRSATSTAC